MKYHAFFGWPVKSFDDSVASLYKPNEIKTGELVSEFRKRYLDGFGYGSSPIPQFNPVKYHEFKLLKKKKDIHSFTIGNSLIMTNHALEILKKCKSTGYKVFNDLTFKNDVEIDKDYKLVFFYQDLSEQIDFNKSSFVILENGRVMNNLEELIKDEEILTNMFSDKEEYKNKNEELRSKSKPSYLKFHTMRFKDPLDYDLFILQDCGQRKFIVSERLKQIFTKNKVKGADYTEYKWHYFE